MSQCLPRRKRKAVPGACLTRAGSRAFLPPGELEQEAQFVLQLNHAAQSAKRA